MSKESIWYVTRLKENALYKASEEYDIPDEADSGVLKDEEIVLCYGENKKKDGNKATPSSRPVKIYPALSVLVRLCVMTIRL